MANNNDWKVISTTKKSAANTGGKQMTVHPFMKDKRYVEITREYVDTLKKINQKKKAGVESKRLAQEISNAEEALKLKTEQFYKVKQAEYQAGRKEIESKYINKKNTYQNPTEELLKRQDFETTIKVSSDGQLKAMLQNKNKDLTEYEINTLELEFKNRGVDPGVDIVAARDERGLGDSFKKDPEYQQLENDENILFLARPERSETMVYMGDGTNKHIARIKDLRKASSNNFDESKISEIDNIVKGMENA